MRCLDILKVYRSIEQVSFSNLSFKVSVEIKEYINMPISKSPHLRRGHFRFLQSEKFVNKKGCIVFVSETMIKGQAKTVYISMDIEKLKNGEDV